MLDVQKERLKHMVANAILELWKKETGSLSPVLIEGTICITAGSGRTTVVQVSNHFSGTIPDGVEDNSPTYNTPKRKMMSLRNPFMYGQHLEMLASPSMFPRYMDEWSPASLTSPQSASLMNSNRPPKLSQHSTPISNSQHRNSLSEQSVNISDIKEESGSDEEEEESTDNSGNTSAGPVIPGTGFYIEDQKDKDVPMQNSDDSSYSRNDSNVANTDSVIIPGHLVSTPKSRSSSEDSHGTSGSDALDLSSGRKEDDLALSPPQNYTAQVRNVIRQRLLASRQNSSDSPNESHRMNLVTEADADDDSKSSPVPDIISPLPPLLNLNLNSPTMLPLQYKTPGRPLHDMMATNRGQGVSLLSPELYSPSSRPPSQSSFDQNGNNKDTLYVNEKGESQKVYRCNYCSKTFLFKSKYYEHLPVHTNVRPFQCHLCSRTYKYKYDLRVHLRTHMGIPTKSTVCPFCTVKFDTNKMLRLHIQDFHRGHVANEPNLASTSDVTPADATDQAEEIQTSI